jgi:hypothetical protein
VVTPRGGQWDHSSVRNVDPDLDAEEHGLEDAKGFDPVSVLNRLGA